jgi:hypothetical protein
MAKASAKLPCLERGATAPPVKCAPAKSTPAWWEDRSVYFGCANCGRYLERLPIVYPFAWQADKTVGEPRVRRNPERSRRTKRPRCSGIETRRLADGEAIPTPPRPGTASRHSSGSIVTLKPRSVGRAGVVLAPALVPPQTEASCPTGAIAAPLDRPGCGIPDRVRVVALAGTQHWPVTAARPVVSPTPGPRQAGRLARAWRLEG